MRVEQFRRWPASAVLMHSPMSTLSLLRVRLVCSVASTLFHRACSVGRERLNRQRRMAFRTVIAQHISATFLIAIV
jgi:hypothetical protein